MINILIKVVEAIDHILSKIEKRVLKINEFIL